MASFKHQHWLQLSQETVCFYVWFYSILKSHLASLLLPFTQNYQLETTKGILRRDVCLLCQKWELLGKLILKKQVDSGETVSANNSKQYCCVGWGYTFMKVSDDWFDKVKFEG